ncbi:histidine kinase [Methylobacterium sp. Leaf456]|uniref:PAS domain S-box protein n=1 Tax=Methylobacterium sp. Leaf456 TaxID=1736382 RepID=UPI0006F87317|nr:PAS domain S-box protein [Methylobacterium sp. Leaf456]KQT45540.1 histidine kinase [Methylobacterium sp. Leaf456]
MSVPASLAFLAETGRTGREILAYDWSGHALGPLATWPPALRSTLATMLGCPAPMFLAWGPDGIVFFNDAYRPVFGDRQSRALGARFREIWADLWDDIGPLVEATLSGRSVSQRNRLLMMDRHGVPEESWWSFTYSPVRDDDGAVNGMLCITAETTAEVLAERARERSEERLDLALSAGGSIGVWDWDVAADRVTADSRFARLYGVDPAVAEQGAPIATFFGGIHADDLPEVRRRIEAALANGAPFAAEYRLVQADGSVRWAAAEGRCIHDAAGRPTRFPGVSSDITERKRTEAALRESEDRFRGIADTIEQMVWSTRPDGFHDYYNARWYEFTGMPDGSTDGAAWNGMFHPEDQERAWAVWRHSLETGETYGIEYRLRHRSGRYRWVLGRAKPLRDASGRIVRWFGTCTDIHDRKLAEERQAFLLALNDTLREAPDPTAVTLAAAAALGIRMNTARVGYGEIDAAGEVVRVERDWTRDASMESLAGESRILDGFGPAVVAELRAGRTLTVEDCYSDSRAGRRYAAVWDSIGCRALVVVPLIREGRLRAIVYLHEPEPRAWTADDVALVEDVAQRVWHAAERARAELAARAQARELRLIADSLPVLIAFFDASGRCRFANAAGADWFGGTAPDGRTLPELIGDAYSTDRSGFEGALAGREARFERAWPNRDGRRRVAEIRYRPRLTPEGVADGAYLFALDVTDRKRMEEVLSREVDARTRERDRLWQTTNDLMGTAGLDGYLRSVNPAWTRLLGWSETELLARPFLDLIDPEDHPETGAVFRRLGNRQSVTDFVDRVLSRDGRRLTVMWTAVPEGDRFHIVGRDITQQRLAEEQLRQAQKMEAVGQLTGGIAHDFNNLLTGIVGSLDLMRTRIGQGRIDTLERYIGAALSSAERAAALTHRLLAFARRQPLEQKPVDVAALLAGMEALLRSTLTEAVRLDVTTGPELWPTLCDSHQLENAILNLAINARDAMPDGGTLTITAENARLESADPRLPPEIEPGDYVAVSVRDTGLGMEPEVVARAFEPFFTTKPMGQGTGLGLSMIYGFARQSGGHVRLDSVPGRGTAVLLYLPRHRGTVAPAPEPTASEAATAGRGETVLVVEDEPVVRDLVVETLRELGYRAIQAQDGPAGLRILRSETRIDLLVTDVGLPGLDGRQLAEQARAGRPELKVLFITGYAENALFGGDDRDPGTQMITKPFPVKALATRIRAMIELS